MRNRLSALVAGLIVAATLPASAARVPEVVLNGALTKQRIVGFGTVTPARAGADARLTLLRDENGQWDKIAAKTVELRGSQDRDGDGRPDSSFTGSFPSPDPGTCKLRLRVPRTRRFDPVRTSYEMPCARPDFPTGTASLLAGTSQTQIEIEIADNDDLRSFGLMFKRRLAADRGMAFQFPTDTSGGFWMRNTLIPLSIAFYAADGTIIEILDMQPCGPEGSATGDCPSYDPGSSYRGALEVNLGAFEEWGISEGDRIAVVRDP